MVSSTRFIRSLRHAFRGVGVAFAEEQSFRLQCLAALIVCVGMFFVDISGAERALLSLAAAFVLVLELANSIVERFADLLKPRVHHYVHDIKDMMAGAVVVASFGAVLVGISILGPRLLPLIRPVIFP